MRLTKQPRDLEQHFGRPNPGEGSILDLKMDEIYVNVAIHEGRAHHIFEEDRDRSKQLKEYPPSARDCHFEKPEDIIDKEHTNVLVVGRPGIGKTSLGTKMLRLWACGAAFNEDHHEKSAYFDVAFLMRFRRFNDNAELNLRELLARAETVQRLDKSVWDSINKESSKVLLIFDGVDEYSRKADINAQEDDQTYKNDVEEKMPLPVLYNKVVGGELLRGASIVTTTRPTAVKYVAHIRFERTVEILGFTSENIKEYVEKFTKDVPGAKKKMWGHINPNINLLSLCYIPMNCFLICHCLRQIIMYKSTQVLPTKMTDIYRMTIKMFFCSHNRKGLSQTELDELKATHMYKPFEEFPEDLREIFNSLGEIAFKGIEEGGLIFESSEVSGLEDCGMFHKLPDKQPPPLSDEEPKPQFCFIHLTVQEFFAAKHLVDTKENKEIEGFVCDHIRDGPWQMVLQFVAGLLKGSSSDIFIKLLPKWTKEKKIGFVSETKTLALWPATREDQTLAVQVCKCLYEINDKQQKELLQNKIGESTFNAIDFSLCSLASTDLAAILQFLENAEEILYINLTGNGLGDLDANEVKKLFVNWQCKLRLLQLSVNLFTDKVAEDFAEVLTHSSGELQLFRLNANKLTDKGAEDLVGALKHSNCKLKELGLGGNDLTDKGAKDLAAALRHSNCKLKQLLVSGNNFTEEGRRYLIDAGKDSNCSVSF